MTMLAAAAAGGTGAGAGPRRRRRILVDTDVDTDDVFAILYLLKQDRSEFDLKVYTHIHRGSGVLHLIVVHMRTSLESGAASVDA